MPKFKRRSAEEEARIQEAVTRLRTAAGQIDVPRLRRAIEGWAEAKRVEAAKDIDHVKDTYRKRAAVIGFRCGVIHHLLSTVQTTPTPPNLGGEANSSSPKFLDKPSGKAERGEVRRGLKRESKATIEFALMMAEYCLQQQIAAFGDTLRNEYVNAKDECQRYSVNHSVFDQLPETFTMDDLRSLKRGFCNEPALRKIISRWSRDHWIEKIDRNHWRKLPQDVKM